MKSLKQLIRQPLKSISGIMLSAIAVALFCVVVSQTLAARDTERALADTFMTVALPETGAKNAQETIDGLIEENPDIITEDHYNGLASAWIPELTVDNYTQHLYQYNSSTNNQFYQPSYMASHSTAIFEVSITSHADVTVRPEGDGTVTLTAEVIKCLGLEEDYKDPVGRQLNINLSNENAAVLEEICAEIDAALDAGEEIHYVILGKNYYDNDWYLRCYMAKLMTWHEEPELLDWDPNYYEEIETGMTFNGEKTVKIKVRIGDLIHGLEDWEKNLYMSSRVDVGNSAAMPAYDIEHDYSYGENGLEEEVSYTATEQGDITYTDAQGQTLTLTREEYAQRYAGPDIARLDGSLESFLEENPDWQQALSDIEINNHCFPIIGVESMKYIGQFIAGHCEISQGRDFTDEELESGAKVCIMSRSLAQANGLSVGDSIDPNFYEYDLIHPDQCSLGNGEGILNTTAQFYNSATTPFAESTEKYVIVGLYEQDAPWGNIDDDFYRFTPNTIFVPEKSVPVTMEKSSYGMFRTLRISNERLYDLQILMVEKGLDGFFHYYDSGYSAVGDQLDSFRASAEKFLPVGLAMYVILIMLFIFLLPGRQGHALAMMDSLGSGIYGRIGHIMLSSLGLAIPGTVIGTAAGLLLWQRVSAFLAEWSGAEVELELSALSLWSAAGAQLVFVAAATLIVAIPMAKRANLMKRK